MARIRSVDFLPEIFRTDVNREFLNATLDQLTQQPKLKRTQGYIGRRFGPGVSLGDSYLLESSALRTNYQLEPGVVFTNNDNDVEDVITYPGIIDALAVKGANVTRHDRLFASETYSWNPLIDFDKFINYGQYYWLPEGPDAVDVRATTVAVVDDFDVTTVNGSYNLSTVAGSNPTLTLVRGGTYTFNVNQESGFWIQSEAGVDGTLNYSPNINSRNVLGVVNNGDNVGTVTFNVPTADAQQFYYDLTDIGQVDLATLARFDSVNHQQVSEFTGIDGITDLEGRTIVFINPQEGDSEDLGWQRVGLYDNDNNPYDESTFEETVYLDTREERYSIFRVTYVRPNGSTDDGAYIELIAVDTISTDEKFIIGYGAEYSNRSFYKNASGFIEEIPLLTAANDVLYYQDGNTANQFGVIKLVDQEGSESLDIADILDKQTYTSPNGVTLTNGLKIKFQGTTNPETYSGNEYYVEGVGESIKLVMVTDLVTPDTYVNNVSGTNNAPQDLDYLTIKRSSLDLNPWTRSNRWFHIDVVNATAEYNNTIVDLDNAYRAKRPIIEFDAGTRLYNFGTEATNPIDVIDFNATDALSNIHGSAGYSIDGYSLTDGSRVVFAADTDPEVRNKIYTVQIVDPDDDSTAYGEIINLYPAEDDVILADQVVFCTSGLTQTGKHYVFNGISWTVAQEKTAVNQAPLFDIFDADGYSYSNTYVYPSTTFTGSKLFSYKTGTSSTVDPVLGFSLTYLNIDNIGDIVFDNNQYTDTFVYVVDSASVNGATKNGFARKYTSHTEYSTEIGWTTSADRNWSRQVFTYEYAGAPLSLDVTPRTDLSIPAIKVYINNKFVNPSTYSTNVFDGQTFVVFDQGIASIGDLVQVKVISKTSSTVAYYEVPSNLESNIFSENSSTFTLGTIRNHYNRLVENVNGFSGEINGANNLRDQGYVPSYGDVIVQHSAPVAPAAFFLRNAEYDFFNSLDYNAKQYEKFKNQILNWVENNETYGLTAAEILDTALADINNGKSSNSTYYWSDMIPFGGDYAETTYTVSVISTRNYNTINVYDFTTANSFGLLVYRNNVLLRKDSHYVVATDGPRITLTFDADIGDEIVIREYASTYGSYVPETPTKLGLFPRFDPAIYEDDTYVTPRNVIQGHDGSITIAFNDVRDDVLLEFENRIYSNLKSLDSGDVPLTTCDVIPGKFRETDYTDQEVSEILAEGLLNWVGWHKLDYKTQSYDAANEFTWNYSAASSRLDGSLLKGGWRGIYKYYYDTDRPHTHPWEMLGITDEPSWWEDRYGPAPWTSGNLVMWEDLEVGYINEPGNERYDSRFVRPGLTSIIPVDSEGNLQDPMATLVADFNQTDLKKSWVAGDIGPVEAAWRRSSNWPFAVQKLFALTKPAEYFSLMVDCDRYKYSNSIGQYVYDGRQRLDIRDVEIFDVANPKHSYINWIVEYNRSIGIESSEELDNDMSNVDVRLCYRIAGFTDKKYLKIFTDKSSPDSSNTSLLIPDESYSVLLYKNQPFGDLQYSSVMVQKTDRGYAVYGNSQTEAYFRILQSSIGGDYETINFGSNRYRLPRSFTNRVVRVPYGYTFTNINSVIDFLASYGEFLKSSGLIFEDIENNYTLNWAQMSNEFLYWANQGWSTGSLINLNPAANQLQYQRARAVVDDLGNLAINEQPLDQNRQPLLKRDYAVTRLDNNFKLTSLAADKSISYLRLRATAYEHVLVFDNVSIFNDLMYQPVTGLRQQRLRIDGYKTFEWNGQLDAQGFILNQDNVATWNANQSYNKGDIVKYKNAYWTAAIKIQPSEEFDFDQWSKVDYDNFSKGLLPNINNKADQMRNYYNNAVANLESDADLLGLGLTGFRTRDYLEALNLDDISQVQIYGNLIRQKGTPANAKLFQGVEFDKEQAEYDIYENWAIKRATYGANDNKRFVEFALNKESLRANPSTIEIGFIGDDSDADQFIAVDAIYKQSIKNTTRNILPELTESLTDTNLPTAGFVNTDDVNIVLFDLSDLSAINNRLNEVRDGTHIWVARSNVYDWNVYRCDSISPDLVTVIDNLNGTLSLIFNEPTGLSVNDIIVIKQFSTNVNGAHRVKKINDATSIIIDGVISGNESTLSGLGIAFKLVTARLDQASDAVNSEFNTRLFEGDKIWVNSDINGKWKVYEKRVPFSLSQSQIPPGAASNIGFGTSATQGLNGSGCIVGAPEYFSGIGGLFCYNKDNNEYSFNRVVADINGVESLGNSIAMATNYAVAGAKETENSEGAAVVIYRNPAQNLFLEYQVLILPDADRDAAGAEFGYDVTISEDERWIYASAIGIGKVYAFNRVDYQDQSARFTTDGNTASYDLTDYIEVDNKTQITVTVNGVALADSEYNLISNILSINDVPDPGATVEVARKSSVGATGDGSTTTFTEVTQLYTAIDEESVQVYVNNVLQRPYYDYSFNIDSTVAIDFAVAPPEDSAIIFRAEHYYRYVDTITGSTSEGFGESIVTTSDGQQLVIGAPTATNGSLQNSGKSYVYERTVERFIVTNSATKVYSPYRTISDTNSVHINNVHQLNSINNVGNETYTINETTNKVTFSAGISLYVGDKIDIDINTFQLVQTLTLDNNNQGAYFGEAQSICRTDCSLYISAPKDNWVLPEAGSVTRFLNRSRVFGTITGTESNPTITVGHSIRIDNQDVFFTNTTVEQVAQDINDAIIPNVQASVNSAGQLVIGVINTDEAPILSKVTVMPGIGTAFDDLGLDPFENVQVITSPAPNEYDHFGSSVHVDYSSTNLVVGANRAISRIPTTFNKNLTETVFDSDTTRFIDTVDESGAVYTFDLLPSSSYTVPGKFVFGQQVYDAQISEHDQFGTAVNFTDNLLIVTSPGYDTAVENIGRLVVFENPTRSQAWQVIQTQPTVVDSRLTNYLYIYSKDTELVNVYLDFIDPINGKLLGPIKQNLDYIGAVNPAVYNAGSAGSGIYWAKDHVGKLWWDTAQIRYLNYNQEDIVYSSKNWGQLFPGSSVDVYEWVESAVPPNQYTGPGTVRSNTEFSAVSGLDATRTVATRYYFWVKNRTSTNRAANKTLSARAIASYIENPQASGIPYAALIRKNVVALYNVDDYISDNYDSVLHIEYNRTLTDNNVFVEYDLIRENYANDFLPDLLYRKLQDSLCGVDVIGNKVPDFLLSPTDKYGVEFRPRKSLFQNKFAALKTYIDKANLLIIDHPFSELRTFNLLTAQEPIPTSSSNAWDAIVADMTELGYQNLAVAGVGYRYLVEVDDTNNGLWTIYEVNSSLGLDLVRVQSYDTNRYWDYTNWYATGYNALVKPSRIVDTYSELLTLFPSEGTVIKVKTNSDGKWELYAYLSNVWERVGLEDGTVQFKKSLYDYTIDRYGFDSEVFDTQYFDQEPTLELRQIIRSINEEFLIGEFLDHRNQLLISMFNYILAEQGRVEWLYKTSLIDVNHKIRNLEEYAIYRKDNQDFVLDYINESKPYHVKIKEFLLRYEGIDTIDGMVMDFDVPAAYDSTYSKFVSPILDDDIAVLETDVSNRKTADAVWDTIPWTHWYDNRLLTIDRIVVTNGGSGYTVVPQVTISGDAITSATATATINEAGEVSAITLVTYGSGYRSTPTITISGGNGSGAVATPYMKQELVRNLNTTIKYDRYEYESQIVDWEASTVYDENQLVRYNDRVYRAINADGSTASDTSFDPAEYQIVAASTLSGVDRTTGFYVADVNEPGLDLALLIDGLDYPGVQLRGPEFGANTGFDIGNFDINLFDNLDYGPEGLPTYSESILDNEIFTSFTGSYVGVDLSGIEAVQALATATVNTGTTEISEITVTELGKGYSADVPPTVTISAPRDNITAAALATIDFATLTVDDIAVTSSGFGYISVPSVSIVAQPNTPGETATGFALISSGSVTGVTLSNNGSGYTSPPTVTFADPPSVAIARATATANALNSTGGVTATTITNGGNSYTSAPAVTVTDPPASVTATATAAIAGYELDTVTLDLAGNYYSVAPTVTVAAPTAIVAQATATATIGGDQVQSISVDQPGYMYQTVPAVTITPASPTAGNNAAATVALDTTTVGFDGVDGDGDGFDAVAFDTEGGIGTFTILVEGDGYTSAPVVTISAPDISGGTQATASATVSGESAPLYANQGRVTSITVTEPGSGYTTAPTVSIAAPDSSINHGTGATATATLDDTAVISITVSNGGSYYDIAPTISIDPPTTVTTATVDAIVSGGVVTGFTITDNGWGYLETPSITISAPDVTPVTAAFTANLTGDVVSSLTIDTAGAGYLTAPTLSIAADPSVANDIATGTAVMTDGNVFSVTIDNPGANYTSAPQVTFSASTGTASHGTGATATAVVVNEQVVGITITNAGTGYDLAPDVIIQAPTRTTRQATGTPAIVGGSVTGITITDPGFGYLRTPTVTIGNPSDIDPDADIVGGEFIDVYNSHAPEELVPGAIFDTLDLKVYTRPGYDYSGNGHGFECKSIIYTNPGTGNTVSWSGLVTHPLELIVYNSTTGVRLYEGAHYLVNWVDNTIQINDGLGTLDEVKIFVYGIGGGNQLFRNSYYGDQISNKILTVSVNYSDIDSMLILVNGEEISYTDGSSAETFGYQEGNYASETVITFSNTYTSSDYISITIFGTNPTEDGSTLVDLGYSYPETQVFTCDGSTTSFTLTGNINGKSQENLIVEHNGLRLQPATAKRHIGDGSSITTYELPDGMITGIDMGEVDADEVVVYVNQIRQVSGVNYQLDAADGSSTRTISFLTEVPGPYDIIDIYVTKVDGEIIEGVQQGNHAGYSIGTDDSSETLTIATGYGTTLNAGDTIAVTTWHDVREQDVFTQVFKGPVIVTEPTRELFDAYGFDMDLFDRTTVTGVSVNLYNLDTIIENTDRAWVTLNGRRLLPGQDYSVSSSGTTLLIAGGTLNVNDVVAVTSFTNSVVPDALGFRVFKDMRDNVAVYRNNTGSQTFLTRTLKWTDDAIYVNDASKLGTPNLNAAIFGILEINGERITYRDVDLVNNTVSGLRRGTAGTGMHREHAVNSLVTDLGRGQAYNPTFSTLNWQKNTEYTAGTIVKNGLRYYRAKINVPASAGDITDNDYKYPTITVFDDAYWEVYDESWYAQGTTTASNGVALQQQTTTAASFLKG